MTRYSPGMQERSLHTTTLVETCYHHTVVWSVVIRGPCSTGTRTRDQPSSFKLSPDCRRGGHPSESASGDTWSATRHRVNKIKGNAGLRMVVMSFMQDDVPRASCVPGAGCVTWQCMAHPSSSTDEQGEWPGRTRGDADTFSLSECAVLGDCHGVSPFRLFRVMRETLGWQRGKDFLPEGAPLTKKLMSSSLGVQGPASHSARAEGPGLRHLDLHPRYPWHWLKPFTEGIKPSCL